LPEHQAAQSTPSSEGADLAPANVPGADRPRASTKRALLIGMLERPEGASVAELGQRLGWLPHTVRAAMTGLRHAGREVTRSKDAEGQSVYRLARPETVGR
jgi:predicted ArsR family transcriptional regulator